MICTNIQIFKQFKEAMKVLSPDVQQDAINIGLNKTITHSEFEISLAIIELMYSCISDENHSGVRDKVALNVLKSQVSNHITTDNLNGLTNGIKV
jgi:hypothetical protein